MQYEKLLSDPFEATDIEWRVQQAGLSTSKKPWVMVIPYITSRAVQQRLDDVFGLNGWKNEFKPTPDGKGYLCGLSFRTGDEWVTKWDGAEFTGIEALKGALSGATKRAAVQLGIGRYLYNLETEFATCAPVKSRFDVADQGTYIEIKINKRDKKSPVEPCQWFPPTLPEWALPNVKAESLIDAIENATNVITLRSAYSKAYKYANSFNRGDLAQKIVKIKDARKAELNKNAKEDDDKESKIISMWLERSVTTEIMGAENESVLMLAKKKLSKDIHNKCAEKCLDVLPFLKTLEKYHQNQLAKLSRR